jgi:hypothetical protein
MLQTDQDYNQLFTLVQEKVLIVEIGAGTAEQIDKNHTLG